MRCRYGCRGYWGYCVTARFRFTKANHSSNVTINTLTDWDQWQFHQNNEHIIQSVSDQVDSSPHNCLILNTTLPKTDSLDCPGLLISCIKFWFPENPEISENPEIFNHNWQVWKSDSWFKILKTFRVNRGNNRGKLCKPW